MSFETRLKSENYRDMCQDSKSGPDREGFNSKHNVRWSHGVEKSDVQEAFNVSR